MSNRVIIVITNVSVMQLFNQWETFMNKEVFLFLILSGIPAYNGSSIATNSHVAITFSFEFFKNFLPKNLYIKDSH